MLSGKAVSRAVRGHFFVDAVLNALLVSLTFDTPLIIYNPADGVDKAGEPDIVGNSQKYNRTADSTAVHPRLYGVLQIFDNILVVNFY